MNTKGSGVVYIRTQAIKKKLESALLERLTPDEQQQFKKTLAISWIPEPFEAKIVQIYSDLSLPGDPRRLAVASKEIAKAQIGGLYKLLFKALTIPFIVEKTASLWKTLNDQGVASASYDKDKKEVILIVRECPDYSEASRELNRGYIEGTLELTGAKNIRVTHDASDPKAWKWIIQWD